MSLSTCVLAISSQTLSHSNPGDGELSVVSICSVVNSRCW